MSNKPVSRGARELAEKIACKYPIECADLSQAAALIDSEMRELLEHIRHSTSCLYGASMPRPNNNTPCTCGLAALLTKWKVEG